MHRERSVRRLLAHPPGHRGHDWGSRLLPHRLHRGGVLRSHGHIRNALDSTMPRIMGIDGCPAGWLCIEQDLETGVLRSRTIGSFQQLADEPEFPAVVAIDIPIGLTDTGHRDCDNQVRQMLKKRGASVFPAPIRPVLGAETYALAREVSKAVQGKSVSAQAYAIYAKVLDVDGVLCSRPELRDSVFEIHPELCFYAWNGGSPMYHPKRTF